MAETVVQRPPTRLSIRMEEAEIAEVMAASAESTLARAIASSLEKKNANGARSGDGDACDTDEEEMPPLESGHTATASRASSAVAVAGVRAAEEKKKNKKGTSKSKSKSKSKGKSKGKSKKGKAAPAAKKKRRGASPPTGVPDSDDDGTETLDKQIKKESAAAKYLEDAAGVTATYTRTRLGLNAYDLGKLERLTIQDAPDGEEDLPGSAASFGAPEMPAGLPREGAGPNGLPGAADGQVAVEGLAALRLYDYDASAAAESKAVLCQGFGGAMVVGGDGTVGPLGRSAAEREAARATSALHAAVAAYRAACGVARPLRLDCVEWRYVWRRVAVEGRNQFVGAARPRLGVSALALQLVHDLRRTTDAGARGGVLFVTAAGAAAAARLSAQLAALRRTYAVLDALQRARLDAAFPAPRVFQPAARPGPGHAPGHGHAGGADGLVDAQDAAIGWEELATHALAPPDVAALLAAPRWRGVRVLVLMHAEQIGAREFAAVEAIARAARSGLTPSAEQTNGPAAFPPRPPSSAAPARPETPLPPAAAATVATAALDALAAPVPDAPFGGLQVVAFAHPGHPGRLRRAHTSALESPLWRRLFAERHAAAPSAAASSAPFPAPSPPSALATPTLVAATAAIDAARRAEAAVDAKARVTRARAGAKAAARVAAAPKRAAAPAGSRGRVVVALAATDERGRKRGRAASASSERSAVESEAVQLLQRALSSELGAAAARAAESRADPGGLARDSPGAPALLTQPLQLVPARPRMAAAASLRALLGCLAEPHLRNGADAILHGELAALAAHAKEAEASAGPARPPTSEHRSRPPPAGDSLCPPPPPPTGGPLCPPPPTGGTPCPPTPTGDPLCPTDDPLCPPPPPTGDPICLPPKEEGVETVGRAATQGREEVAAPQPTTRAPPLPQTLKEEEVAGAARPTPQTPEDAARPSPAPPEPEEVPPAKTSETAVPMQTSADAARPLSPAPKEEKEKGEGVRCVKQENVRSAAMELACPRQPWEVAYVPDAAAARRINRLGLARLPYVARRWTRAKTHIFLPAPPPPQTKAKSAAALLAILSTAPPPPAKDEPQSAASTPRAPSSHRQQPPPPREAKTGWGFPPPPPPPLPQGALEGAERERLVTTVRQAVELGVRLREMDAAPPAPVDLRLRVGAQVRLLARLPHAPELLPGAIGRVVATPARDSPADAPVVVCFFRRRRHAAAQEGAGAPAWGDGAHVPVGPHEWRSFVPGAGWACYTQFPLDLVWAVTPETAIGLDLPRVRFVASLFPVPARRAALLHAASRVARLAHFTLVDWPVPASVSVGASRRAEWPSSSSSSPQDDALHPAHLTTTLLECHKRHRVFVRAASAVTAALSQEEDPDTPS